MGLLTTDRLISSVLEEWYPIMWLELVSAAGWLCRIKNPGGREPRLL